MKKKEKLSPAEVSLTVNFAVYHLNVLNKHATLENISQYPLLKGISKKKVRQILKHSFDMGILRMSTVSLNNQYFHIFYLAYPETIEAYGMHKGWLEINRKFNIEVENNDT